MKNEKWIIYLLAALNFTHILDFMIMMPMGEILMNEYDLRPTQFSLLVSSYTICAAISGFFASFVVDRYPRKKSLLFIYSGFLIGTFLSGISGTYEMLLLTRGVTGAFGGIMGAQVMAIITDLIPFERRGSAIGMLTSAFSAASVVGVPLGLFLATKFHWNVPFFFIVVLGMPLAILIYRLLPVMDDHLRDGRQSFNPMRTLRQVFSIKNQRLALLQSYMITLAHFIIIPFITPYMIRNVGFEQDEIVYIYIVGGSFTVFMAPLIGRLIDKYRAVLVYYILVTAAIIPVVLLTNMPPVPVWAALIVTTLFFILGGSRMIPSSTIVSGTMPPAIRGSFMSLNSSTTQLGTATASLIAGYIVTADGHGPIQNYDISGYVAIGISLLTFLVLPRLKVLRAPVVNLDQHL